MIVTLLAIASVSGMGRFFFWCLLKVWVNLLDIH